MILLLIGVCTMLTENDNASLVYEIIKYFRVLVYSKLQNYFTRYGVSYGAELLELIIFFFN